MYSQSFYIPGKLEADARIGFRLAQNCSLVHVSAGAANKDHAATLAIGDERAREAFLPAQKIGQGGDPQVFTRLDFAGGQYPFLPKGSTLSVFVDFDGRKGTPAEDVTLVLTFLA